MEWTKDKSIRLSLIMVYMFAAILLALDIVAPLQVDWFTKEYTYVSNSGVFLLLTIYSGSVAAWICLWHLRALLQNLRRGKVFVKENVRSMRIISWCCAAAALICVLSTIYCIFIFFVAIPAAFMMLIVRIVKNAFQQAIEMKSELDLTV